MVAPRARSPAAGRVPRPRGGRKRALVARPALERREYARRRVRLTESMDERCAVIIPSAPVSMRNRDIEYAYRPDSDFIYVTGFPEPQAVAVLLPGRTQGAYLMFCRERDRESERWIGPHNGLEEACAIYGADDAFPVSDLGDILPGLLEDRFRIYYAMGSNQEFDHRMLGWINRVRRAGPNTRSAEIVSLDHLLHDMRLYKSSGELRLMRRAAEISAGAHLRAMARCRPGLGEFEIEAELLYAMHRGGARWAAYPSIVAAGENACALHYTANHGTLEAGDLILVDAGAEFEYYAADIARTYPVCGRFSVTQRELYQVVLTAQETAIEALRPGAGWEAPHRAAVRSLTAGLIGVGILSGDLDELVEEEGYGRYLAPTTGHWIGLDVHDVGDYRIDGEARILEPGMTMTVEPGLYIPADDDTVHPEFRGIGIRIEDDVLVTRDGPEVLSAAIPKTIAELEDTVGHDAR